MPLSISIRSTYANKVLVLRKHVKKLRSSTNPNVKNYTRNFNFLYYRLYRIYKGSNTYSN
jgi:hypothetical protein